MNEVARPAPNLYPQYLQVAARVALEITNRKVSPWVASSTSGNVKRTQGARFGKVHDAFRGLMNNVYRVICAISSAHNATTGVSAELSKYLQNLVEYVRITCHDFFKLTLTIMINSPQNFDLHQSFCKDGCVPKHVHVPDHVQIRSLEDPETLRRAESRRSPFPCKYELIRRKKPC
jgi:hypothetical protein